MFKATEVERKMREINLAAYQSTNKIPLLWDSLGTKKVSSTHVRNFWKVNKSWR